MAGLKAGRKKKKKQSFSTVFDQTLGPGLLCQGTQHSQPEEFPHPRG